MIRISLIALSLVTIFAVGFTMRYPLAAFADQPLATMATLSNLSLESFLIYVIGFVVMFVLYAIGAGQVRRWSQDQGTELRKRLAFIVGAAILFNAVLLPMYPFDAADIFDYIMRGRITTYYGANPMDVAPSAIAKSDPFYPYVGWKHVPGAYGAAWEWIAALTVRLAGHDLIANVIAFKVVAILGYLATGGMVVMILRRVAPERALLGAYLWLWNPFVILMTGEGGHNDTVMAALMLLGVYGLVRRWYIAATLAALLAALVKFVPLALVAIIAVIAVRDLSWRLRLRYVAAGGALSAALFFGVSLPFWTGDVRDVISLERRTQLYTGSVATIIRQALIPTLDRQPATAPGSRTPITNALISRGAFALLAIYVVWQLHQVYRDRDPMRPIRALTLILMFYMLVSSFWFMSWYVLWAVPLAALLDDTPLRRFTLTFSYLVTWEMVLYQYITLRPTGFAPLPWRDLIPVAAYMGVAWAWVARYWLRQWVAALRPRSKQGRAASA
jgi:hypothetical protein